MIELKPKNPIICYGKHVDEPTRIPADEKFLKWRNNPSARTKTATFVVEYINFPADNNAKNAFQFALDIWATELKSSVPIRVRATWAQLNAGVLGQAIWGNAYANFEGAQQLNTFYPVALAEKMAGRELNASTDPDIVATFNANTNWYTETNGLPTSGTMDLVTIVLHEIGHGLGFTDTYNVSSGQGTVGLEQGGSSIPFVYDLFIENESNARIFNSFASPSSSLASQITSNALFFNSPSAIAMTGSTKPRVYAPTTFNGGSSIAHLDESTYTGFDPNKLMTPQIAFMESIHNPGDMTRGILNDMGWLFTKIQHDPLDDTERQNGQPYPVTATIVSDNGYVPSSVKLNYTTNGTTFTSITMTPTSNANEFTASLPGTVTNISYGYYISVNDIQNREFTNPGKTQTQNQQPAQSLIVIVVGPDTTPPEIEHVPVDYIFDDDNSILIDATVTDNIEVELVTLEYKIDGGALQTMNMIRDVVNYTATIPVPAELTIGDKVEYRIIARDASASHNIASDPASDFFKVFITGIMPTRDSYSNDFNVETNDFIGNSFSVTTPAGFPDPAIHSAHPYANGSGPNDESNYTYQLQIPIRINKSNPFIQFDEIVLVEPGEAGSEFGDSDFYDFVVTEGSRDGGLTWIGFADGYDSRDNNAWLTQYNSTIVNNLSTANGTPGLYRTRTINMLEKGSFADGHEVLIRFRLFADQGARGWGWAIDNLKIQDPVTGVQIYGENHSMLQVYPNPASKAIVVSSTGDKPKSISISDSQGRQLSSTTETDFVTTIDISEMQSGFYYLKVQCTNGIRIRKFLKLKD